MHIDLHIDHLILYTVYVPNINCLFFFISKIQVIVNKLSARRKRNTAAFPSSILNYDKTNCKAECFYIAAELENKETDFVVGDGKSYGGYKNAELEPATTYKIYVRGVSYNDAKVAYICFSFNYFDNYHY